MAVWGGAWLSLEIYSSHSVPEALLLPPFLLGISRNMDYHCKIGMWTAKI